MATIHDVAALAGVSSATVSRALNGRPVSSDKLARIMKAVDQVNYSPDRAARALRTGNPELIALVIPDVANPFFTDIARGAEDAASQGGYSLILCNTDSDVARENRYLENAIRARFAGVIIAPASNTSDLSSVINAKLAVVQVDRTSEGFDLDSVVLNNRSGGRQATSALIGSGYTRIGCITGPRNVETARHRVDGWRDALKSARLPRTRANLRHGDFGVDSGYSAMQGLLALSNPPDAVFVCNNLMAVGAIRALAARGTRCDAIALAVFGKLPYVITSGLVAVIPLPARALGAAACGLLLQRITQPDQPLEHIVLSVGIEESL